MTKLLTTKAGLLTGVVAGCLLLGVPAYAAGLLAAANGMTIYTYDNDTGGVSSCYDACAANWPPYLGKAGETAMKGQTLAPRRDGSMQWTQGGKPLYFFAGDKKKGDKAGDGRGGVWHTVAQ